MKWTHFIISHMSRIHDSCGSRKLLLCPLSYEGGGPKDTGGTNRVKLAKILEKASHFRCVPVVSWSESVQNGANRPIICWSELDGLRHQETSGVAMAWKWEMRTEVIDLSRGDGVGGDDSS